MTENNSTINFYYHPIKVSLLLLAPIFMSFVIWILFIGEKSTFILFLIALYIIIYVVITTKIVKLFRYMILGKPVLILTKDSLIDNLSKKVINWNDISDIAMRGGKSNYISLKLYDSEKYITKLDNSLIRRIYRFNSKTFHGTFTIGVDLLKGGSWNILKDVQKFKTGSEKASA